MTNTDSQSSLVSLTVDQVLQQAIVHHEAGRLQDAERLYRAILQTQPSHPNANHNIGVLALQAKHFEAGLSHLRVALEARLDRGEYWVSYIDALMDTGQTEAAWQVLEQGRQHGLQGEEAEMLATRLAKKNPKPAEMNMLASLFNQKRYPEAAVLAQTMTKRFPLSGVGWKMLGAALQQAGRVADALAPLQKAAALSPGDAEAHYNLGVVQKGLGQLGEAEASYRRALQIKPDYALANYNLGAVLLNMGQLDEAEASYRRALQIKPDYVEAHVNLGATLRDMGRLDEAETSYRRALQIKPDFVEAHSNLGAALQDMGRLDEAEASYRRALQIKPDYALAHNNLGTVLRYQDRLVESDASYRHALQFKPDFALAHSNLGATLQDLGRLDEAEASYRRALQLQPDYALAYSNLLFIYNFLLSKLPEQTFAEARRYGEMVARQARPYMSWSNVPDPARCLRVGLVSGDLRQHPVGNFLEGVLAALSAHAAGRLEFHAYSNHFCPDAITERIKASCRGWHSAAGLSDEALARQIHEDGIDILLDLSGHTANNRLPAFAWKPAPVQVTWLGYLATTGVAAMDYLIADSWTLPETQETQFTEKIWRLPKTYLCFTPPQADEQVAPLPALNNGYITFGCFNNLGKVNNDTVALWARVLHAVPGSRLFLKTRQLNEAMARQGMVERFAAHGIGADRLILRSHVPRAEYLAPYHQVDIALDPFPYPGITTTVEGLWMGVPVLTLAGKSFLSRQGVGLLMNAGLPEWIAADADDYVACAVSHAGDLQRLAILRNGLRQQVLASPIFDASRFAMNFEAVLRGMWTQWCDQQQGQSS